MIMLEEVTDLLSSHHKRTLYQNDSNKKGDAPVVEHYLDQNNNTVVSRLNNVTERLVLT